MKKQLFTNITIAIFLTLTTFAIVHAQLEARARNVVANLYKAAKTKDIADWNKAELKKYFDTELTNAISKVTHGENGIDFDILYNAQDTQIKNFRIGEGESQSPSLATVDVSFSNFGEKEGIQFLMVSYGEKGLESYGSILCRRNADEDFKC